MNDQQGLKGQFKTICADKDWTKNQTEVMQVQTAGHLQNVKINAPYLRFNNYSSITKCSTQQRSEWYSMHLGCKWQMAQSAVRKPPNLSKKMMCL